MFGHTPSQGDLSFSLLLRALRGLTLWQPILVYAVAAVIGIGLFEWLSFWPGGWTGDVIGTFLLLLGFGVGYLGAGGILLHEARGDALPGIGQSLRFGLRMLPRLVALMIIEGLLLLGLFVVELVVFLLCNIPGIGPILFVPFFPLAMLVNAVVFLLAIIVFNLSGPALWHGESVGRSLRHTINIARSKPGSVLLMMLLLVGLAAGVGGIFALILYTGFSMTLAAAAPVMPQAFGDFSTIFWHLLGAMSANGQADSGFAIIPDTLANTLYNGGISSAVALAGALIFIIPNVVFLLGMAHIYIEALELVAPEDV